MRKDYIKKDGVRVCLCVCVLQKLNDFNRGNNMAKANKQARER